jgi:molecular chaperone HscB
MTYFDLFSLPVRFALDLSVLEQRYRELSQRWHPDRHGRAPAAERAAVLQRATDLNEAYRTLKNEGKRAEYLLKLSGIDIGAETPDRRVQADPAFLAEIMELREALDEARRDRDHDQVQALDQDVRGRMAALLQRIKSGFERLESGDQGQDKKETLSGLSRDLVARRYYQRFRDEIDAYEEARAEAAQGDSVEKGPVP